MEFRSLIRPSTQISRRAFALAAGISLPSAARAAEGGATSTASIFAWIAGAVALALLVAALHFRKRLRAAEDSAAGLAAGLEQARSILDTTPQAVVCWDKRTGEATVSGTASRLLGNGVSPAAGPEEIAKALDPDDEAGLAGRIRALVDDFADFDLELRPLGRRPLTLAGRAVYEAAVAVLWMRDDTRVTDAIRDAQRIGEGFRRVLDVLPFPVWRRRRDLTLDYVNPVYRDAVEAAPDTAPSDLPELAAGAIGNKGKALAARALKSRAPEVETHHVVGAGARRLMEFTERPVGGDGAIAGFAVDRTEIEEMETQLSRHLRSHDEVLQNLGTAISIYAADQRLDFYNNAFVKLWQLDEAFLDGGPTLGEVLESLRERRRLPEHANFPEFKASQLALFTSLLDPVEELMHLPDGTTLRSIITPHPFGGLLMTWEDVTASLALERSYNTLIAVQKETLDNLYEGVAVIGGDGRLQLSNPAFGRIWQFAEDELASAPHISQIAERMRDFVEAEDGDWDTQREDLIALLTDREGTSGRLERADGSVLEFATVPLPDGATLLSYLDVSDSHRVEQFLRERNEALETADRLKSEFIANVSYELRTPLNTIIGFAEILDGAYFGELNQRQTEYSRGILESSQRLLALINDILDLATIESGQLKLDEDTVDVYELLESVLNLTRERVIRKDLRLDFDCPRDIGPITADDRRLKQALFNILSNSVKFTPEGGDITVSARRVERNIVITFTDTGIGIPQEDHARIFGKFERGDAPEARRSGAGLGLSLVKSFIDLHGGTVELESEPGVGTKVVCTLPVGKAGEEPLRQAGTAG